MLQNKLILFYAICLDLCFCAVKLRLANRKKISENYGAFGWVSLYSHPLLMREGFVRHKSDQGFDF